MLNIVHKFVLLKHCNTQTKIENIMNKAENIKEIFKGLTNDRKEDVKYQLHKEFGISTESIKNLWFYDAKIPKSKIDRVREVVRLKMQEQISEAQNLINVV